MRAAVLVAAALVLSAGGGESHPATGAEAVRGHRPPAWLAQHASGEEAQEEVEADKEKKKRLEAEADWEGISEVVNAIESEATSFNLFKGVKEAADAVPEHGHVASSRASEMRQLVRQEVEKEFGDTGERLRVMGSSVAADISSKFDEVRAALAGPLAHWRQDKVQGYRAQAEAKARADLAAFEAEVAARREKALRPGPAEDGAEEEKGEGSGAEMPRLREVRGAHAPLTSNHVRQLGTLVDGIERLLERVGARHREKEQQQQQPRMREVRRQPTAADVVRAERAELARLEAVQRVLETKRRLEDEEEQMLEAERQGLAERLGGLESDAAERSRRLLAGRGF